MSVPTRVAESSKGRGRLVGWLALLVGGQGASLALISSGKKVTYQHFRLGGLVEPGWPLVATCVLVLQVGLVLYAMRGEWERVGIWLRDVIGRVPLAASFAVLLAVAAAPSRAPLLYGVELLLAFLLQLVAVGALYLAARAMSDADARRLQGALERWLGASSERVTGRFLDPFAVAVALATTVACAALAVVVFQRIPHLPDEIAYLLNARYFALGALELPAPPVPAAFDVDLVYYDATRSFVPVPPGWPALLALGVKAGVPWLVNPVLSGVSVLLVHALLRRFHDVRTARLATLLLATSPWFLFLGMSLMTHQATLAFAVAAALGVTVARERNKAWPAALAGVATGVVGLIRPLEGVVVAVVVGLWSLGARQRRLRLLPSAALTTVAVAVGALSFPHNAHLTGSATTFPILLYTDKYYGPGSNDMGFGANRGMGWGGLDPFPGHGAPDVVVNSLLNGFSLNTDLFGWAIGSLVLVVAFVASRRLSAVDWAMLAIASLVIGVHALYWFSGGPDFGARYWYLTLVPLVALAARAPAALFGPATEPGVRATGMVLALVASTLLTFVPWRATEKYRDYRFMTPAAKELVRAHDFGRALVLVRGRRHPDYHMASLENPLDLTSDTTVFAWDRSADVRAAVVAAYPDRPVYLVDGPTLTNDGFRVIAGPLVPGSLLPGTPSSDELLDAVPPSGTAMSTLEPR